MIELLKTYLDVCALRKGPDAIPASSIVLGISVALLAVSWFVQVTAYGISGRQVVPALVAYAVALIYYATVTFLFGFGRRLTQMLSTLIACGSLIAMTSVAVATLLAPIAGAGVSTSIATLIWIWSVPVKGHIVARTIDRHWFVGIALAMLAYVLRFGVESSFFLEQEGPTL